MIRYRQNRYARTTQQLPTFADDIVYLDERVEIFPIQSEYTPQELAQYAFDTLREQLLQLGVPENEINSTLPASQN